MRHWITSFQLYDWDHQYGPVRAESQILLRAQRPGAAFAGVAQAFCEAGWSEIASSDLLPVSGTSVQVSTAPSTAIATTTQ